MKKETKIKISSECPVCNVTEVVYLDEKDAKPGKVIEFEHCCSGPMVFTWSVTL